MYEKSPRLTEVVLNDPILTIKLLDPGIFEKEYSLNFRNDFYIFENVRVKQSRTIYVRDEREFYEPLAGLQVFHLPLPL